jgi:hypothetical protein
MSFYNKDKMPQKNCTNSSNAKQTSRIPFIDYKAIIQRVKMEPQSLTHEDAMVLQRTIGNQAVCQMMRDIEAENCTKNRGIDQQIANLSK